MSRKSPAFSFYPDSWIGGTSLMTDEERGVYIQLLAINWLQGSLSFSHALAITFARDSAIVERVLNAKFRQDENGNWFNERLEDERKKQFSRSQNGEKGAEKRWGNSKPHGKHDGKHDGKPHGKTYSKPHGKPHGKRDGKTMHSDSDSDSDSITDTDSDTQTPSGVPAIAGLCGPSPTLVRDTWNQVMNQNVQMSDKRKKALRARHRDEFWCRNWRAAIEKARASSFCNGGGSQGWIANLDWFLRPDTVAKLIEGNYDSKTQGQQMLSNIANNMEAFVNGEF